ncbi:MAG: hypothetical protein D6776_01825, partial [Planctomycetota bacterium]
SNGSWVNGRRVAEHRLQDGDRVKIGGHVFAFETQTAAAPEPPPAREPVVFCERCFTTAALAHATRSPSGGWWCPRCVDSARELPNDLIDGFTLLRRLGHGRMGPLFLARHDALRKHVAIKILLSERVLDRVTLQRFIREAKIGGRLYHPNIVEFYDAAQCRGTYYISMEYVEGESLRERVERAGPLAPVEVAAIGAFVAEALAHAHRHGVIHRNVRPENVLLGVGGEVKLGDFGFARLDEPGEPVLTPPGQPLGSLCYMPPEQFTDAHGVDERADVFGLGATLYHALTGQPPFLAETIEGIEENVLRGALVPLQQARPDVPPELATTIAHCLAHQRAHRYRSADELTQALRVAAASGQRSG